MKKNDFDFKTTFPPLGHPEHHFNKYPEHPWLKSKEEIDIWIKENANESYGKCKIYNDLTIEVLSPTAFWIENEDVKLIPFKIRFCYVWSLPISKGLKSLIGVPYLSNLIDFELTSVESLDDFPYDYKVARLGSNVKSFIGMRDIKNTKVVFYADNIESWDGFASDVAEIKISKDITKEKVVKLIMSAPERIRRIELTEVDDIKKINSIAKEIKVEGSTISSGIKKVDMAWLRSEQLRLSLKFTNDEIDGKLLDLNKKEAKKRKI